MRQTTREVFQDLRVQLSLRQGHGQTHVTHFSTGQLLCEIPHHQANGWWYSFNTGQCSRSHRGLICL